MSLEALILAYLFLIVLTIWGCWFITRSCESGWPRLVLISIVLALFFAPSFVMGGHSAALAPAWVAIIKAETNAARWEFGVKPMAITFVAFVIFGCGVAVVAKVAGRISFRK